MKGTNLSDCIAIGPQKTGTTWLARYFEIRNDICLPESVKETFFFDRFYEKGLDWYASHFTRENDAISTVEVAPTYFYSFAAPDRIVRDLGKIRLLCTLRDPAERTFSHYLLYKRYGLTDTDFRQSLTQHSEIIEASFYATQLKRWRKTFGLNNIKVLFLEDLKEDANRYVSEVCKHLDLPHTEVPPNLQEQVNAAALPRSYFAARTGQRVSDKLRSMNLYGPVNFAKKLGLKKLFFGKPTDQPLPQLNDEDHAWLYQKLKTEILELEDMLEIDLSHWKR